VTADMKPRGRPQVSAEDRSVSLHLRLSAKHYDLTQKQASQARLTHADWLRRVIARACGEKLTRRS
jgi:hypothetical protein